MKRFCAFCGKETGKIIRGLCVEHFLEKNPVVIVPEEIAVETDKTSGMLRHREKWLRPSNETMAEIIKSKIKTREIQNTKFAVLPTSEENFFLLVVQGKIGGLPVETKKKIKIKPVFVQSDAEMKLRSGYHEAILQIRFKEKPSFGRKEKILQEIKELLSAEKRKDALSGISGIKEKRSEIDLMIGSKKAAKKIVKKLAQKYDSHVSVSHKTIGVEKTGKEKKRFTYCVRI